MAFITNSGAFPTLPYPPNESYLQLAHPSVPDVLLLNQMSDGGDGYTPPVLTGLATSNGRANGSSLVLIQGTTNKLEWRDLAFVVSPQQVSLLEQLATAQNGVTPCTVVDNMLKNMLTRVVIIQLADGYKSIYSTLSHFLVQFSLLEV